MQGGEVVVAQKNELTFIYASTVIPYVFLGNRVLNVKVENRVFKVKVAGEKSVKTSLVSLNLIRKSARLSRHSWASRLPKVSTLVPNWENAISPVLSYSSRVLCEYPGGVRIVACSDPVTSADYPSEKTIEVAKFDIPHEAELTPMKVGVVAIDNEGRASFVFSFLGINWKCELHPFVVNRDESGFLINAHYKICESKIAKIGTYFVSVTGASITIKITRSLGVAKVSFLEDTASVLNSFILHDGERPVTSFFELALGVFYTGSEVVSAKDGNSMEYSGIGTDLYTEVTNLVWAMPLAGCAVMLSYVGRVVWNKSGERSNTRMEALLKLVRINSVGDLVVDLFPLEPVSTKTMHWEHTHNRGYMYKSIAFSGGTTHFLRQIDVFDNVSMLVEVEDEAVSGSAISSYPLYPDPGVVRNIKFRPISGRIRHSYIFPELRLYYDENVLYVDGVTYIGRELPSVFGVLESKDIEDYSGLQIFEVVSDDSDRFENANPIVEDEATTFGCYRGLGGISVGDTWGANAYISAENNSMYSPAMIPSMPSNMPVALFVYPGSSATYAAAFYVNPVLPVLRALEAVTTINEASAVLAAGTSTILAEIKSLETLGSNYVERQTALWVGYDDLANANLVLGMLETLLVGNNWKSSLAKVLVEAIPRQYKLLWSNCDASELAKVVSTPGTFVVGAYEM